MNLREDIEALPSSVESELQRHLTGIMNQSSLFYRIFVRCKSADSAEKKIRIKGYDDTKKMQDLYGARIALYFKDDIAICRKILEQNYEVIDLSEDKEEEAVFAPTRLNYVCKLPKTIKNDILKDFWVKYPIDDTFEIQIRTIFSEGWHEVEHDLRYKCKKDWEQEQEMSRALNGIFATLETCNWSIISLFDKLAYKNYQNHNWEAMIRDKLRIRIKESSISEEVKKVFDDNSDTAKKFYRLNREEIITNFVSAQLSSVPKTFDNVIFILNILFVKDPQIDVFTPPIIKHKCNMSN